MNRHTAPFALTTLSLLLVVVTACSSSDNASVVSGDSSGNGNGSDNTSGANRPLDAQPPSVFENFIAPARIAPITPTSTTNLLSNPDFEDGIATWNECQPSTVSTSSDAYRGNEALSIDTSGCLYQAIEAQPGQSYSFSCFVKLNKRDAWTGLGMTFSNGDYQTVSTAPSATATSTEYTKIETSGVASAGTAFTGVWVYSDHGALVDNCTLTLAEDRAPIMPSTDENLLSNADFSVLEENDQAAGWLAGCARSVIADGSSLYLADGSCVDQALSPEALAALDNRSADFSCAVAEVEGFSDMSVFVNNELVANKQITPTNVGQRIHLQVPAGNPVNGFVSLYSEGHLRVENCALTVNGAATGSAAAPAAESPSSTTEVNAGTDTVTANEPAAEPVDAQPVSARYRATFNATWSADTHPVNFPAGNPHFSPLTGVVHNDQAQFWAPQTIASEGIKVLAETGNPTEFLNEISAIMRNGDAVEAVTGGGIALSPGSTSVEFEITPDFPLVSFATMIAPSPDWFLGVHDLSLMSGGDFIDSLSVPLIAYDSGTDSGVTYTSSDFATTPAVGISRVDSAASDSSFQAGLPAAGVLVFERIQ